MRVTRRGIQLCLAGLWLLDGALQFQPYMFTTGFGHEVISPAGDGQPVVVSGPVHWAAHVIASHPVPTNAVFAVVQTLVAVALLYRPFARAGLAGTIVWSLAVWWFGEGFGGLLSGHAMLLTGAPGAVIVYAAIAVAAWPSAGSDGRGEPTNGFALVSWVGLWAVGAIYQLLPGQNTAGAISGALTDAASDEPHWLASTTGHLAHSIDHHAPCLVALVLVEALVALAALVPGETRRASLIAGSVLAAVFWAFGQAFGQLFSGHATDPNSGLLVMMLAVTTAGVPTRGTAPHPVAYPLEPATAEPDPVGPAAGSAVVAGAPMDAMQRLRRRPDEPGYAWSPHSTS